MSVYQILKDIRAYGGRGKAYGEKQIHKVPDASVVERVPFVVEKCQGRTVLDIGHASGALHSKISAVAKMTFGLDKERNGSAQSVVMDLDDVSLVDLPFPTELGIDLIVCGEVIEHLANPGWLLQRLARTFPNAELLITVPNAFSAGARSWLARGIENVHVQHCAWYSWHTLKILVERYSYNINEWHWYNGEPLTAEGLIFVCKVI